MSYWDIVEPYWDVINIYDGTEAFQQSYRSAPKASRLLFAVHFATSEICNGGFHQFFHNSTGVLAPEAAEGFREIGQGEIASIVESAITRFGVPYPRDRELRVELLSHMSKSDWEPLEERFYKLLDSEAGGFENAADAYATRSSQ
jgi:hypothetical protein